QSFLPSGIAASVCGIARIGQLSLAQPLLALLWSMVLLGERVTRPFLMTTYHPCRRHGGPSESRTAKCDKKIIGQHSVPTPPNSRETRTPPHKEADAQHCR